MLLYIKISSKKRLKKGHENWWNLFKTTLCRNVVHSIEVLETLTLQKHESLITIDSLLALLRLMTNSYCATRRQRRLVKESSLDYKSQSEFSVNFEASVVQLVCTRHLSARLRLWVRASPGAAFLMIFFRDFQM